MNPWIPEISTTDKKTILASTRSVLDNTTILRYSRDPLLCGEIGHSVWNQDITQKVKVAYVEKNLQRGMRVMVGRHENALLPVQEGIPCFQ